MKIFTGEVAEDEVIEDEVEGDVVEGDVIEGDVVEGDEKYKRGRGTQKARRNTLDCGRYDADAPEGSTF
jgi:hypothetical protein